MIQYNKKIADVDRHASIDEENLDEDASPEKIEEKKLMSKYPQAAPGGGAGKGGLPTSQFFQKRLQQRKFFDSGDYNMAKAKGLKLPVTPKTTCSQQAAALSVSTAEQSDVPSSPTGVEIPTPDTVPHRKTSLIQSTASKLSPQPLHHLHSPTGDHPLTVLDAAS